jgi:pimeloyl-ACP methyl ester carboxylesterase
MTAIYYRTIKVDDGAVFYREAGAPDGPKLLLLHGPCHANGSAYPVDG